MTYLINISNNVSENVTYLCQLFFVQVDLFNEIDTSMCFIKSSLRVFLWQNQFPLLRLVNLAQISGKIYSTQLIFNPQLKEDQDA